MGQKSGGMDAGALIGIPTLYIEDSESNAIYRMADWVREGTVPYYRATVVDERPSIFGKILRGLDQKVKFSVPKSKANGTLKVLKQYEVEPKTMRDLARATWRRVVMLWFGEELIKDKIDHLGPPGHIFGEDLIKDVNRFKEMVLQLEADKKKKAKANEKKEVVEAEKAAQKALTEWDDMFAGIIWNVNNLHRIRNRNWVN